MDSQLVLSITSVTSYLSSVNVKVAALQKSTQDPSLHSVQVAANKFKGTLVSLGGKLHHPATKTSIIAGIQNQDGTMFQYINNALTTSIGILKELGTCIKGMKGGSSKPSIFQRKGSAVSERKASTVPDTDLLLLQEKIHILDLVLQGALQMIEIHKATEAPSLQIHSLKAQIRHLDDIVAQLKASSLNIAPVSSGDKPASSASDLPTLCSRSIDFATHQCSSDESEMTRRHSGFVPMAPLVEVNTNATIMPSFDEDDD